MATPVGLLKSWMRILGYQALGFLMMAANAILIVAVVPPRIYGDYVVLLSIIQVVSGIGLSWVAQSTLLFAREEAVATGDVRGTLLGALLLQAGLFAVLVAMGWLVRPKLAPYIELSPTLFLLIAAAVALMAAFETISYVLQGAERFDGLGRGAALNKLGPLCALLAIWAGAAASADLLLIGMVGGFAAASAITFAALPPRSPAAAPGAWSVVGRLAGYGMWLPAASTAGILSAWMHIWFVRAYGGAAEAGVYGWAASIHLVIGAALMPLSAVIAPHLIDLAVKDAREASRRRVALFQAVTLLAAVAAPIILAAVRSAGLALPERYANAGPILVLLLAAVPAQLMMVLVGPLLRAHPAMIKWVIWVNVLMAAASLVLNLALTTRLGGTGAAIALGISVWCGALALNAIAVRLVGRSELSVKASPVALPLAGLVSLAGAIAVAHLSPVSSVLLGLPASLLLLVAVRSAGLLRPLATLSYHLDFLPPGPRLHLTRFLLWCDTGRRSGTQGGTG